MTATLDKTGDSWFHDFVLSNFGLTPFINTFPDFSAGGAVMITALFIAAGMEVRIIKYISYKFQIKLTSVNKTINNIVFITDFWMYEMKRPEEVIEGQVIEGGIYSGRNLLRESY